MNYQTLLETERRADLTGARIIDVKFVSYCAMVYKKLPCDLPRDQVRECRNAFFAGMALYQGDILSAMGAPGDVTGDEVKVIERYSNRVMQELEDHSNEALAEVMPTEGSA